MKFPAMGRKSQFTGEKFPKPPRQHSFRLGWKSWRSPLERKLVIALIVIELPLTIAGLALTGIADPDTYRDKLWEDGYRNGFNSDPRQPLYAAANYETPVTPLVWSHFLTQFNLVICVLSMFLMLAKSCMIFVGWLAPPLSVAIHSLLVGLYAYSVYGQTSPDTIEPGYINNGPPWYITKSCDVAFFKSNVGYCRQAKALFYVFAIMLALFAFHILFALHSIFFAPDKHADPERNSKYSRRATVMEERQWEMVHVPPTPGTIGGIKSPMTPRTTAFNALDGGRDLPLREKAAAYGGYYPPPPKQHGWRW